VWRENNRWCFCFVTAVVQNLCLSVFTWYVVIKGLARCLHNITCVYLLPSLHNFVGRYRFVLYEKHNVDVNTKITFVNYFVGVANWVVQLDHYLQMVESKVNYLFYLVSVSSGFNTPDMTNSWTSPHTQLSNRSLLSNDNRPPGSYSGAISNDSTTDTPSSSCSGATGSLKVTTKYPLFWNG